MKSNNKTFHWSAILMSLLLLSGHRTALPPRYSCNNGEITINSVAALELITAQSNKLHGVIDTENRTFAWTVEIRSFQGFNSPLQREHFNENYMETTQFPKAKFTGKIIEQVNFEQAGTQSIRAKGILSIHGVDQERIVKSTLSNHNGKLYIQSKFTVPVADHNISIPRIVHQKIAEEIEVTVTAVLSPQ